MTTTAAPSLAQGLVPIDASDHVVGLGWLTDTVVLACADGAVHLAGPDGTRRIDAHPDAGILCSAADGRRFVTGGDDGRIVSIGLDGTTTLLAQTGGAWIDSLALGAGGAFAYGAGRVVSARDEKGREKTLEVPTTARGLSFAPKGYRLAIAHYNGATLWFPNVEAKPELLDWKGSHLDVTWSPDARFVVTSMQENALHGWRLQPDRGHMRMSGYPAKCRSLSWSSDGKWLATSGAEAAIVWPFESRDGPMGKAPRECGVRPARVSRVAFHPNAPVLAAGYEDGCILLIRLSDASELLVRPAAKDSGVTGLAWSKGGKRLAFGCSDGQAAMLTLPA